MNRPRLFKGLGIAFTATCGIAAVLLVVLWVRSVTWRDRVVVPLTANRFLRVDSSHGICQFETYGPGMGEMSFSVTAISHEDISAVWKRDLPGWPQPAPRKPWRFEVSKAGRFFSHIPHWFLTILFATLAAAPWLPYRFSLRTLLITTTLIALVLVIIVWLR